VAGEAHALARKSIEVRCSNEWVARNRETVRTELIQRDEQDIGSHQHRA
jgi:hypothetical protein